MTRRRGASCTSCICLGALLAIAAASTAATILMLQQWRAGLSSSSAAAPARAAQAPPLPPPLHGAALLQAVDRHHPINRLQCGAWVGRYAQLHRDILAGRAPQRFSIMRSRHEFGNGLADRLASSVSVLLHAVLTDRAFQYDWDPPPLPAGSAPAACGPSKLYKGPGTHLWEALRSDFIDWRYSGPDVGNATLLMDYNCDERTDEFRALFASKDLAAVGGDTHTVLWHTDHAGVVSAFTNPHLQARLAALGLTQDTAFACLFDFLYRPVPEVVEMFAPTLNVLLDPNAFKIGLQIRVGDWQLISKSRYLFKPQHYPSLFRHYFQCAEEIERAGAAPGQRVVWYTLSDMPELRAHLAARYAPRILTDTSVTVTHTVKSVGTHDKEGVGFKQAAGELWSFSLTQHHVLTQYSGFGKVGAMLSAAGPRHIYRINQTMNLLGLLGLNNKKDVEWWRPRPPCTPEHADPLLGVCTEYTGI